MGNYDLLGISHPLFTDVLGLTWAMKMRNNLEIDKMTISIADSLRSFK